MIILVLVSVSCKTDKIKDRPNIILIMADDMGYECLSSYESVSYSTPVLDSLASQEFAFPIVYHTHYVPRLELK